MAEAALIQMGISPERAREAINASSGDFEAALTWLMSHPVFPVVPPLQATPEEHPRTLAEKCRRSEEQCSYNYQDRCAIRMCAYLWMVLLLAGGLGILIAGFIVPVSSVGTSAALALTVSGVVSLILGIIIVISWVSAACCCQQWWCWSCK